jgi:hypothetical protein
MFPPLYRYVEGDGVTKGQSPKVKISYYHFAAPNQVDSGIGVVGTAKDLQVEFEMFPELEDTDFAWIINEGQEDEIRVQMSGKGIFWLSNQNITSFLFSLENR